MDPKEQAGKCKVDGTRRRRRSPNLAKRRWYAIYRAFRFAKHFGFRR